MTEKYLLLLSFQHEETGTRWCYWETHDTPEAALEEKRYYEERKSRTQVVQAIVMKVMEVE